MRDINRIEPFMRILTELWLKNPDLKFGQLISNIFSYIESDDMFFSEDYKWLEAFKEYENRSGDDWHKPKEEILKAIDIEFLKYSKDIIKAYNKSRNKEGEI
jgi:hypothetical protein